jgi:hypothetical protein
MTNLNLNAEEYGNFLRCITNFREICNDIDIREGIIRQRSNDKTTVFEMDLTPIITGINIPISDIKKKLELLKTFTGQDVEIEIGDDYFKFSDSFSSFNFKNPTLEFMDNKFISQAELESVFVMDNNELLLDTSLSTMITDRIRITTQTFNTAGVQVEFDGDIASIRAATQAKDQFARFVSEIPTNLTIDKCSANLSTVPFCIEHDTDVEFKMFKHPTQDITMNRFATTLGDIIVTIYGRSTIVKDGEE